MSVTKRKHKEVKPGNGVECTCYEEDDKDLGVYRDQSKCEKLWYCCDCDKEMMHRYGDLFARCRECWARIESNL